MFYKFGFYALALVWTALVSTVIGISRGPTASYRLCVRETILVPRGGIPWSELEGSLTPADVEEFNELLRQRSRGTGVQE
jgi:hypothetical protein